MCILKSLVMFLVASAAATSSFAQVGGSISGTVKDPSGAVVPGVSVAATNTVLGREFNAVTDGQGLDTFPKLAVGKYDITMVLDGFKPQIAPFSSTSRSNWASNLKP